jgi:hypothetical protein
MAGERAGHAGVRQIGLEPRELGGGERCKLRPVSLMLMLKNRDTLELSQKAIIRGAVGLSIA